MTAIFVDCVPRESHFSATSEASFNGEQIPERYIEGALAQRNPEQLEDGSWAVTISGFDGVWAEGKSEHEAV